MGLLNANEMVDEVLLGLNNPDSDELSPDMVLGWLNRELVRIVSRYPFPEFSDFENLTTSNGTAEYTMTSTNVMFIVAVSDTTNKNPYIRNATRKDMQLWSTTTSSGRPTHYIVSGTSADGMSKKITFWNTPAGAYVMRIEFRASPEPLLLDDIDPTYTILPPIWDDILITKCKARGWMHLNEFDKAQPLYEEARNLEAEAYFATFPAGEVPGSVGLAMSPWGSK